MAGHTLLQPFTSISVSSFVHFLRGFFSCTSEGISSRDASTMSSSTLFSLLSLSDATGAPPLADMASRPISSRKGHSGAGINLGEDGKDTRLCLAVEVLPLWIGNGAVKEKVDDGALRLLHEALGSSVAMVRRRF